MVIFEIRFVRQNIQKRIQTCYSCFQTGHSVQNCIVQFAGKGIVHCCTRRISHKAKEADGTWDIVTKHRLECSDLAEVKAYADKHANSRIKQELL